MFVPRRVLWKLVLLYDGCVELHVSGVYCMVTALHYMYTGIGADHSCNLTVPARVSEVKLESLNRSH